MLNCSNFLPLILARYFLLAVVLGFLLTRRHKKLDFVILGGVAIAGGANVYQQLTTGCVYDPFDFFGLFHFNVQDLVITIGSLLLLWRQK